MIIKYVQHITNPCSTYKQALVLPRSPFFETASFTNRSHDQIFLWYGKSRTIANFDFLGLKYWGISKKVDISLSYIYLELKPFKMTRYSQKSLLIEIISFVFEAVIMVGQNYENYDKL